MLSVEYRPSEIYLARIEIDPDYQGRGIGTRLIGALAYEARQKGQDLVLDVLTVNHRAQVSIHGVPGLGCQLTAGSGGSQGFPSMTARTASSAVVPCAAAESR
ncbi:MAG: GNAT family N-acetyltransferase [Trebonia sp.]